MSAKDLLTEIERFNEQEFLEAIHAIIHRYRKIHPEEELIFLSLPSEPVPRRETLELLLKKLQENTLE